MEKMNLSKSQTANNDMSVIPDIPTVSEAKAQGQVNENIQNTSQQPAAEGRKLFANKKMNIFLGVVAIAFIIVVAGVMIYANI